MPHTVEHCQLFRLADKIQRVFKAAGAAESSFITTARLKGFNPEIIHEVAATFWQEGYSAKRRKGKWCFEQV